MKQLKEKTELKEYYQDAETAQSYLRKRFSKPDSILLHQNQIKLVNYMIERFKPNNVLEIAPGPARLTVDIKGKGTLLDASPAMLKLAKKHLKEKGLDKNWKIKTGDAFKTGFKANSFDLIYTFRFVRHFEKPDRIKLFKEWHRILAKNGFLIFEAPEEFTEKIMRRNKTSKDYPVYDDFWTKKTLLKEMRQAGFKVMIIKESLKLYFPQTVISNIANKFDKKNIGLKTIKFFEKIIPDNLINKPKEWLIVCQK